MLTCSMCGGEIASTRGIGYRITGVEVERDQGGTNHVMMRERTGEVVCRSCISDYRAGVVSGQMTIGEVEVVPWAT